MHTLFLQAGLIAGVTEAILIVTPFEVIKTRLQKQHGTDASKFKYKGPIHTVQTIAKEEGIGALWNGVWPTAIRQGSNQAFNFMMFIFLQKSVFGRNDGDGQGQSLWKPFLNGLIASCFGPIANCPMDVIKTRLMAQSGAPGEVVKYHGWVDAFKIIAKEEGMGALWKGLGPRLARSDPQQRQPHLLRPTRRQQRLPEWEAWGRGGRLAPRRCRPVSAGAGRS